jgi:hypothetical protein
MPDTESQNASPEESDSRGLVVHVAGPAEGAGLTAARVQRWGTRLAKLLARASGSTLAETACVRWN